MEHDAILDLIDGMAGVLHQQLDARGIDNPAIIGIHTGGTWVAQRLHELLRISDPTGLLDISFYRDDFTQIGVNPQVRPSQIAFDVDDRDIILVDDVLHTGRTIRAAMNEIYDYGRPATITLVVSAMMFHTNAIMATATCLLMTCNAWLVRRYGPPIRRTSDARRTIALPVSV